MATNGTFDFNPSTYAPSIGWTNYARITWSATWSATSLLWTVTWNATAQGASNNTRWNEVYGTNNGCNSHITVTDENGNVLQTKTLVEKIAQSRNNTVLLEGSFTVGVTNAGTRGLIFSGQFNFETTGAAGVSSGTSSTFQLDPKPLASTISSLTSNVSVGSSGGASTVNISRNSSSYTHTVKWTFGSYSNTATNVGTSTSYTIPASWLQAIPNAASGSATVTVTTFYGSTQIGNPTTASFTITAAVNPSIGSVSVSPSGNPSGITQYIAGYTKAAISASSVSGVQGSTIKKVEFLNGSTVLSSNTTPSYSYITGAVSGSSATFGVRVTDSRGRTATKSASAVTIAAYATPNITANAYRSNSSGTAQSDGTYLKVTASATATPSGTGGNSITAVKYSYKATTSSSWSAEADIPSGAVSGFANTTSYDVRVRAQDAIGNSSYKYFTIPTAEYTMDFKVGGKGVAFGKVAETDNLVDSEWDIKSANNITGKQLVSLDATGTAPQIIMRYSDKNNANAAMLFANYENNGGRLWFREYSGNSSGMLSYSENYSLPKPDAGRASTAYYDILTTKGAGTVSGATSSHTINAVNVFSVPIGGYCRIIEVTAVITLTSAVSNGSVLITGLPVNLTGAAWWFETVLASSTNGTMYQLKYGTQSGGSSMEIQSAQSIASGTQIRIHFVYFAKP